MESLHPLIVHFPIALLLAALLLDILAVSLKRPNLHNAALWNMWLGAVGAAIAVLTGLEAGEIAKHSFEIHQVMELHQRYGFITLGISTLIVLVRLWGRDRFCFRVRLLIIALMFVAAGTLTYGAHLGGRLVYEFGVGGEFGDSSTIDSHHSR